MAYDFIPTKASEIYGHSKLKNYVVQAGDMVNVFDYLRNLDSKIDDPIAIDVDKKMVKILPAFEKKVNLTTLKSKLKLKIKPEKGMAVYWMNVKSDKTEDYNTLHSGNPPMLDGTVKLGLNIWVREKAFQ